MSAEGVAALLAAGACALTVGDGFVLLRIAADEAEIITLAVAPAARRAGLGRTLLEAAFTHARDAGAARMFLEVAETNGPARRLYAQSGFVETARRARYYGDGGDALVLVRRLDAPVS